MAAVGQMILVKAVLTAIAIYHLTPLDIPVEVLQKIDASAVHIFGRARTRFSEGNAR